mgnify:CR=1 FL=1
MRPAQLRTAARVWSEVRKRAVVLGVVVVGLVAAFVLTRGDTQPAQITSRTISIDAGPREVETVRTGVQSDADPTGTLRLEGQVIDAADEPVQATVVIDSNPPRELVTEADGSFVFEQLTPRTYRIAARAGDAIAGVDPADPADRARDLAPREGRHDRGARRDRARGADPRRARRGARSDPDRGDHRRGRARRARGHLRRLARDQGVRGGVRVGGRRDRDDGRLPLKKKDDGQA